MSECPDTMQLLRHLMGECTREEREAIDAHVRNCHECAEALKSFAAAALLERRGVLEKLTKADKENAASALAGVMAAAAHDVEVPVARGSVDGYVLAEPLRRILEGVVSHWREGGAREAIGGLIPRIASNVALKGDLGIVYKHLCAIWCEFEVLRHFGLKADEEALVREALAKGWYDPETGTPLDCVGNIMESRGLQVDRRKGATLEDLERFLGDGCLPIVAVDIGEILAADPDTRLYEAMEDLVLPWPDHCTIVCGVVRKSGEISSVIISEPSMSEGRREVSSATFANAWDDSGRLCVVASFPHTFCPASLTKDC